MILHVGKVRVQSSLVLRSLATERLLSELPQFAWEVKREPSSTMFDLLVFNGENKSPEPPKTVRQVIHFFLVQVMIW